MNIYNIIKMGGEVWSPKGSPNACEASPVGRRPKVLASVHLEEKFDLFYLMNAFGDLF